MNFEKLFNLALDWLKEDFISVSMAYQILILLGAIILGHSFFKVLFEGRLNKLVDSGKVPVRIKRTLKNLIRLISPALTLLIAYLATTIASSEAINIETGFLVNMMKIILAWVVIRATVEFIGNKVVRNIFAVSILIIATLSIFGVLDETSAAFNAFGFSIGDFRLSALTVIKGMFALFGLLYLALFISSFAERQILRSKSLTRSSQVLVAKVTRVVLVTLAFIIAITSAGIDLSIFAVLSGAIGLGIGFGLQKVVSNLFSGMLLLMDKSIQPGDVIELEDSQTFGWVNHMGARYTEIITRDNKSYLIPNEDFVTQRVVNWSHDNDRLVRLSVEFGIHYDSDIHQVIALAKEAAKKPVRVTDTPEPVCWITDFGDSSVNFTLRFWIKDAEGGVSNVKGEVLLSLWDTLKENNIEIPYPHRVVHMIEPKGNERSFFKKKKTIPEPALQDEAPEDDNPVKEKIEKRKEELEKKEAEKRNRDKVDKDE